MFGFEPIWFIGVVEDRNDPLKVGRCRVRCLGFHQQDSTQLKVSDLPWAQLLISPNTNSEIKPPKEGSWVLGFFKDGKKRQEPMIVSLIPGIPITSPEDVQNQGFYDKATDGETRPFPPSDLKYSVDGKKIEISEGFPDYYPPKEGGYLKQPIDEPDTPRASRNDSEERFVNKDTGLPKDTHIDKVKEWRIGGKTYEKDGITKTLSEQTVCGDTAYSNKNENIDRTSENSGEETDDGKKWKEKETKYNSSYPYNKVEQSESGHVFEVDDTKGAERIHQQHRSGTFYEIHPDGSKVEKVMADNFKIIQQNEYNLNLGNYESTIKKDKGETVEKNSFVHIKGDQNVKVDKNSFVETVGNDIHVTSGEKELTVVKDSKETVKENKTVNVDKDSKETVKENKTVNVDKDYTEIINGGKSVYIAENSSNYVEKDYHSSIAGNSKTQVSDFYELNSPTIKLIGDVTIQGTLKVTESAEIGTGDLQPVAIKGSSSDLKKTQDSGGDWHSHSIMQSATKIKNDLGEALKVSKSKGSSGSGTTTPTGKTNGLE